MILFHFVFNENRNVGVTYSKPPGRCASEMGSFTVNYTLNTGWTHPAVQYIVRHVSIHWDSDAALLAHVKSMQRWHTRGNFLETAAAAAAAVFVCRGGAPGGAV